MRDFSKEGRIPLEDQVWNGDDAEEDGGVEFLGQTTCSCWRSFLDRFLERTIQIVPW
jgi:hypothetical protein